MGSRNTIKWFVGSVLITIAILVSLPAFGIAQSMTGLSSRVDTALTEIDGLGAHNFDVEARGGTVTLSGFVASEGDRTRIEDRVRLVDGVREVKNNLEIRPIQGGDGGPSQQLAVRVQRALKADPTLKNFSFNIGVRGGAVTLTGEVATQEEFDRITEVARAVPGVRAVANELKVKGGPDDDSVRFDVVQALALLDNFDVNTVDVIVEEGVVHLRGSCAARRQVDQALSTILMVPGVKDVVNELTVKR